MHIIKKSLLFGRVSLDYTGGPIYEAMVEELRSIMRKYGHLLRRGESLSGDQWIRRIKSSQESSKQEAEKATYIIRNLMC